MKTYMRKVGKTLLLGLVILAVGLIPMWLIISEVRENDVIFYVGFVIVIIFIAIVNFFDM